jgi:hypothetical protein
MGLKQGVEFVLVWRNWLMSGQKFRIFMPMVDEGPSRTRGVVGCVHLKISFFHSLVREC